MYRVPPDVGRRDTGRRSNRGLDARGAQVRDVLIDGMRFSAPGFPGQKDIRSGFKYRESLLLGHWDILNRSARFTNQNEISYRSPLLFFKTISL